MPKIQWGVLLDLDQTLILTDGIELLRRQRRWKDVYGAFGRTQLPPGTRDFIRQVQAISRVGVVTSSPRTYAERLLVHHALELPVLVAYHDVKNRKPHPEPVLRAAEILGIPIARCIHVGDSASDVEASIQAGAMTVGLRWNGNGFADSRLHAACCNWEEVWKFIVSKTL